MVPKPPSSQKVKQLFGDFCYIELEGGRIRIEPGWVEDNIVTVGGQYNPTAGSPDRAIRQDPR